MKILYWAGFVAGMCCLCGLGAITARAGESAPGPCGGLTANDAAAILHVPPTDIKGPRVTEDVELKAAHNCQYRDANDFFKSVSFTLSVEKSAAAAEGGMNVERQNFAGTGSVVALKNLGDEAWRYTWRSPGPPPRLLMRKGNVWLDVMQPEDEASQIKIAQIVLAHLQ